MGNVLCLVVLENIDRPNGLAVCAIKAIENACRAHAVHAPAGDRRRSTRARAAEGRAKMHRVGVRPGNGAVRHAVTDDALAAAALLLRDGEVAHDGEGAPAFAHRPAPEQPRRALVPIAFQASVAYDTEPRWAQELVIVMERRSGQIDRK